MIQRYLKCLVCFFLTVLCLSAFASHEKVPDANSYRNQLFGNGNLKPETFEQKPNEESMELISDLYQKLLTFRSSDPLSSDFKKVAEDLFQAIDAARLSLERESIELRIAEHGYSSLDIRKRYYETFIEPVIQEVTAPDQMLRIVHGVKANSTWLQEVASRTVFHNIGFFKLPLISLGGQAYKLSPSMQKKLGRENLRYPSIELRAHFFIRGNEEANFNEISPELIHTHGFDLYSRVSRFNVLVDDRVQAFTVQKPYGRNQIVGQLNLETSQYPSQMESRRAVRAKSGLDLDYMSDKNTKRYEARETYRPYFIKIDRESDLGGYEEFTFKPEDIQFEINFKKSVMAEGGTLRFHPSEEPHFVTTGPSTNTTCVTLRRYGKKPSYVLATGQESSLPKIDAPRKPNPAMDPEKLKSLLFQYSSRLEKEVEIEAAIHSGQIDPVELQLSVLIRSILFYSPFYASNFQSRLLEGASLLESSPDEAERFFVFVRKVKSVFEHPDVNKHAAQIYMDEEGEVTNAKVFVPLHLFEITKGVRFAFLRLFPNERSLDINNLEHLKRLYALYYKFGYLLD